MRIFTIAAAMIVSLGIAGCQTTPVSSSNPNAGLSTTGKPGLVSFGLQGVDFEFAAKEAVDQFLVSPWYEKRGGGRWVVMMDEVVNDTTFRIDTASMTSRMKRYMVQSGNFVFTAAVGAQRTSAVADYRQLSQSAMFSQSSGATGRAIKPNLAMAGVIRQRTVVDGTGRKQQLEYEFDFRVIELGTGLEIFQAFVPIDKLGSNKNFAW